MGAKGMYSGFLWGNLKEIYSMGVLCIDMRNILKWMLE
jgi:hypothetical protein